MAGSIVQETICDRYNSINLTVRKSYLEEDLSSTASIAKRRPTTLFQFLPSALGAPTSTSPAVIPFKGIPTFKQVQLYNNYRRLLPIAYQDITCPKPSMESLKLEEEDQKRRKMAKKLKVQLDSEAMKSVKMADV
jgi:hypothetical protein